MNKPMKKLEKHNNLINQEMLSYLLDSTGLVIALMFDIRLSVFVLLLLALYWQMI